MELFFHVEIPILIDNSVSILKHNSYARGYHAMDIWKPLIGDDSFRCKREDDHIHDENAVAVIHSNHSGLRLAGHVQFLYSSTFRKFLFLPNLTIRVLVTGKRIKRSAGWGLEIPVKYVFHGNEKALQWAKKILDNIYVNVNKKVGRSLK